MAVLFAVYLNEKMMKTKTDTNKQTKSEISTSELTVPSIRTHAQSYFSGTGACGLPFSSLLGLLSIIRPLSKNNNNQTTNKTKPTKKETHQELVFQWAFFFLLLL